MWLVYKEQDKLILKQQYRGIVRNTRIFEDYKQGLRKNNRIYRQNIRSTSINTGEQQIGQST